MNITCPHCSINLNVPDHKLPKGRDAAFKCPKCSRRVEVQSSQHPSETRQKTKTTSNAFKTPEKGSGSASSGSLMAHGRPTAMVCMGNAASRNAILSALSRMGFDAQAPESIAQALQKLEYYIYPLVVVDEAFDRNKGWPGLSAYMNDLDMSLRRRICLVLVGPGFEMGDNMAAMHASVNFILSEREINQFADILPWALSEHENLYIVYNEAMKAAGKA